MKERYFLQFDFYNKPQADFYDERVNKFWYGIVTLNLEEQTLNEFCKEIIRQTFSENSITIENLIIKVNAFNRV